jgi:hypothetical protein
MAQRARQAGLPFPPTHSFGRISGLIAYAVGGGTLPFPLIVKSRRSRRGDLVTRVDNLAQLRVLEADWRQEPVVVQEFVANDGWDHKLWVIGSQLFAGLRRTPLDSTPPDAAIALDPAGLAPGWLEMARDAGKAFGLVIYGIDILATTRGPVIVDVNAFPGCRNMPGAPEALAGLVERFGADALHPIASAADPMLPEGRARPASSAASATAPRKAVSQRAHVPIAIVHERVRSLLEKLDGVQASPTEHNSGPVSLRLPQVVYLRRKPGRGLVAVYRLVPEGGPRRALAEVPGTLVTVSVSEQTLTELQSLEPLASPDPAELEGSWPGTVRWPRIGMVLQAFPADVGLPELPAALVPSSDSSLAAVLAAACRTVAGEPTLRVVSIQATPQRYKPGSRCVIRYRVRAASSGASSPPVDERDFTFFGKVYRDRTAAVAAHELAQRLWSTGRSAQPSTRPTSPFIPRPLALIDELGLVLTAAADSDHGDPARRGPLMLRPRETGDATAVDDAKLRDALVATADALAWWHTSGVTEGLAALEAGSTYADRARVWAAAVVEGVPALVDQVARVVDSLATRLSAAAPERAVAVHGAFKPSQLLFCGPCHPVITDLDAVCLSDSALDVGYFLAYLRPPGLWCGRRGHRAWFLQARAVFVDAYLQAMQARGASLSEIQSIRRRINLFEAALILKIASRRARRLNSPRPSELEVVMAEINGCLQSFADATETRE